MNSNLKNIIKKIEYILCFLILCDFVAFSLSYAITNIVVFLFPIFFLLDTKIKIKEKFNQMIKSKLVLLFVLFYIIQVIGALYSQNITTAIRQLEIMLPILFLPAILSVERISIEMFNKILRILKYAILLFFIYYLYIHFFIDGRTISTFVHFTINKKLGISQVFIAYILLLPLLEALRQMENNKELIPNTLVLALSLFFLFLLGNKTTVLFLIILGFQIIFKLIKINRIVSIFLIILFPLFGFIAYHTPILKNRINVVLKTTDFNIKTIITKNRFTQTKNTLEHRLLINHLTLIEIKKSFPFGVGTGDFQDKLNLQYQRVKFKFAIQNNLNNHNQYFSEFLKTGLLGGIVFIILILNLLKKGFDKDMYFAFPIIFLFAMGSIIESNLSRQHGVFIFALMIPFFLNQQHLKKTIN